MSALEEIVDHLDTTYSQWVKSGAGHNIFGDVRPEYREKQNRSVFLHITPGGPPMWGIGGRSAPVVENMGLQIVCRSKFASEARDDCNELYNDLPSAVREATLGSTLWHHCLPTGVPSVLDRDSEERTLYAVNFNVMKQES